MKKKEDNICVHADLHAHIKNTVPVITVKEGFIDIGVELAVRIDSTRRLTRVWIIHQLKANVRASEIHSFVSQFKPVC